jgi:hypothetical protein
MRNLEKCPECLQRFHVEWQGKSSRKGISLILNYVQSFILCCEVKFLLDTKLIDSKNFYNSEVFCFCCCGYEVVYYYLFEN